MQQLFVEAGILLPEKAVSFEEFIALYPEDGKRYELHLGVIQEMPLPTGTHEDLCSFIAEELTLAVRSQQFPYRVARMALVKYDIEVSGFMPDVVLLDRRELVNETLWQKSSVIQNGQSIPLVVEVVSSNWRNDYGTKLAAYEALGIQEYWIVDYLALGAVRYLGKPKQPTVTICQLIDGEYELFPFIEGQTLQSQVLPSLELNVDDIFGINNETQEMS